MICNIVKSGGMSAVLDYNERKVAGGEAERVAVENIPAGQDEAAIRDTFEEYRRLNRRTKHLSFHMSIDPIPGDGMDDAAVLEFARDMMEGLGYGDQPYVIYRHHDIDRVHWHVVSIRTDRTGRSLRNKRENLLCQKTMKLLQRDYHYRIGNEPEKTASQALPLGPGAEDPPGGGPENPDGTGPVEENPESASQALLFGPGAEEKKRAAERKREKAVERAAAVPTCDGYRFDPRKGDLRGQLLLCLNEALTYNFTTFNQFRMALETHGMTVREIGSGDSAHFVFQGMSADGKAVTRILDERTGGVDFHALYERKLAENISHAAEFKKDYREERRRLAGYCGWCLGKARDRDHLVRLLSKRGLTLQLSYTPRGEVFGLTVADRTRHLVFKGDELEIGGRFGAAKYREAERAWKTGSPRLDAGPEPGEKGPSGASVSERLAARLRAGEPSLVGSLLYATGQVRKRPSLGTGPARRQANGRTQITKR